MSYLFIYCGSCNAPISSASGGELEECPACGAYIYFQWDGAQEVQTRLASDDIGDGWDMPQYLHEVHAEWYAIDNPTEYPDYTDFVEGGEEFAEEIVCPECGYKDVATASGHCYCCGADLSEESEAEEDLPPEGSHFYDQVWCRNCETSLVSAAQPICPNCGDEFTRVSQRCDFCGEYLPVDHLGIHNEPCPFCHGRECFDCGENAAHCECRNPHALPVDYFEHDRVSGRGEYGNVFDDEYDLPF